MANTAIQPAQIGISGDVRRFRVPELGVTPHHGIPRTGGGIALGAYLPIIPATTPGGATTPYAANFDPGLAAIDAAGNVELIKWLAYFASLEFYPAGTDGRVGVVANYGHMESSNARSVGTASAAGTPPAAAAAAAARIRDHEDLFEIGAFADPTRFTRVAVSGSLYEDVYGDGTAAKNYAVILSGWLFF